MSSPRAFACLLIAALSAGVSADSMKLTPIEARDIVTALGWQLARFEFALPVKSKPGSGYNLQYWVEDWRGRGDKPLIVDRSGLGLGSGGPTYLLMKFPEPESGQFSLSTPVNGSHGSTSLQFGDEAGIAWYITDRSLVVGRPITIGLRVEGGHTPAGDTIDEKFDNGRRDPSLRVVAFRIEIREVE